MKFIVDRRTWYRGYGPILSYLLDEEGQRCCIGFVVEQCGVSPAQLLNAPSLHSLAANGSPRLSVNAMEKVPGWMKRSPGKFSSPHDSQASDVLAKAYGVNDNPDITDAQREAELKLIFSQNGDEIEFIN